MFSRIVALSVVTLSLVACASAAHTDVASDDAQASSEEALVGGCGPDRLIANAPEDRKAILQRAAKWVRDPVPYDQSAYKDGHRTDCSGFVSMAWGHGDFTTAEIPPRSTSHAIAEEIEWSELSPGDAVARGPSLVSSGGHVMLYAGTDYLGFSCFWEQTMGGTRIASVIKTSLTGSYAAIRRR